MPASTNHHSPESSSHQQMVGSHLRQLSIIETLPTEILECLLLESQSNHLLRSSPFVAVRLSASQSFYRAYFFQAFYGRHLESIRKWFRLEHLLPARQARPSSWELRQMMRTCLHARWCTMGFVRRLSEDLVRMAIHSVISNPEMAFTGDSAAHAVKMLDSTEEDFWRFSNRHSYRLELEVEGKPAEMRFHHLLCVVTEEPKSLLDQEEQEDLREQMPFSAGERVPIWSIAPDCLASRWFSKVNVSMDMEPNRPFWHGLLKDVLNTDSAIPSCLDQALSSIQESTSTSLEKLLKAYTQPWESEEIRDITARMFLFGDEQEAFRIKLSLFQIAADADAESVASLLVLSEIDPTSVPRDDPIICKWAVNAREYLKDLKQFRTMDRRLARSLNDDEEDGYLQRRVIEIRYERVFKHRINNLLECLRLGPNPDYMGQMSPNFESPTADPAFRRPGKIEEILQWSG